MNLSVSITCEQRGPTGIACGKPTRFAYPALRRGDWMALCTKHAAKHMAYCEVVEIVNGFAHLMEREQQSK